MRRYREGFHNLLFTDYLEFHWYVGGELRRKLVLAALDDKGRPKEEPGGVNALAELMALFFQEQAPQASRAKDLAQRMARLARIVRELTENVFKQEGQEIGRAHV